MEKQIEDLKAIREMMEKSSKFLSLSGLSGVMAGSTAIVGSAVAYYYILEQPNAVAVPLLILDALLTLFVSISFGVIFSVRKARQRKLKIVNSLTLKIVYNLAIPLAAGGILSIILICRNQIEFVAAITLIFYGLALVNTSKYTLDEIHYLGLTEIVLGICAAVFLYHGIIFWTIGFGFCHIVYGLIMYKKYDLN
jgi:hypothetical protein